MTEGMKIRYKRKVLGMTTEDLGERCCLTKQTISNIELEKPNAYKESTIKLINYELAKAFLEWDPETHIRKQFEDMLSDDPQI